jgi:ElaB/YqjD/DUF883 family membrane-anchored ribosome-binding protein
VKLSFLILLLSISINTQAGDRLDGISGSMGKSTNLLSKLLDKNTANEDVSASDTKQPIETTLGTKLSADSQQKSADTSTEINHITAELDDTIDTLGSIDAKPEITSVQKKPTQLLNKDNETLQTTSNKDSLKAVNEIATPSASKECVKEKVYSLDVDNAAQYERLEDFPYTYECVIQR